MRPPAWVARLLNPAFGTCYRCGYPWSHVQPRTVYYEHNSGCFALCTGCWADTTLDQRLSAHWHLVFKTWGEPHLWPKIAGSVLAVTLIETAGDVA